MLTDNQLALIQYRREISRLLTDISMKLNEMCALATKIEFERATLEQKDGDE